MELNYLDFDYAEDTEGVGTFDAMAATWPEQAPAVHAEIALVLGWACAAFAQARAPLDEGGEWDYDLQGHQEVTVPESLEYDPAGGRVRVRPGPAGRARHVVTFSITGTAEFCAALGRRFGLQH